MTAAATVSRSLLLAGLILALAVTVIEFRDLRTLAQGQAATRTLPAAADIRGGHARADLARVTASAWSSAELPDWNGSAFELLRTLPLDHGLWWALARRQATSLQADADTMLATSATAVSLAPAQRASHWQAAQIALQMGEFEQATSSLKHWLQGQPGAVATALASAQRWNPDLDTLLDQLLPPQREYLQAAMRHADRQRDVVLAAAVWRRAAPEAELDDPMLSSYVELLMRQGRWREAAELWAEFDPSYAFGDVPNGRFQRPLDVGRGLNWRDGPVPASVTVYRDVDRYRSPPASLAVRFAGTDNIDLRAPSVRFALQGGQRYRLSGYWRAEALSTRARPYLRIEAEGARLREQIETPRASFDWTPWAWEFELPAEAHGLRISLRRDSTTAFDRNLGGILWLDDVVIEPLAPEAGP